MKKIFKDDDSIEKVVGGFLSIIVIAIAIIEIFIIPLKKLIKQIYY